MTRTNDSKKAREGGAPGSASARRVGFERGKIIGRGTCLAISFTTCNRTLQHQTQRTPKPDAPGAKSFPANLLAESAAHSRTADEHSRFGPRDNFKQLDPLLRVASPVRDFASVAHEVLLARTEARRLGREESRAIDGPGGYFSSHGEKKRSIMMLICEERKAEARGLRPTKSTCEPRRRRVRLRS